MLVVLLIAVSAFNDPLVMGVADACRIETVSPPQGCLSKATLWRRQYHKGGS
jgi:hypothetical protein